MEGQGNVENNGRWGGLGMLGVTGWKLVARRMGDGGVCPGMKAAVYPSSERVHRLVMVKKVSSFFLLLDSHWCLHLMA